MQQMMTKDFRVQGYQQLRSALTIIVYNGDVLYIRCNLHNRRVVRQYHYTKHLCEFEKIIINDCDCEFHLASVLIKWHIKWRTEDSNWHIVIITCNGNE